MRFLVHGRSTAGKNKDDNVRVERRCSLFALVNYSFLYSALANAANKTEPLLSVETTTDMTVSSCE